MLGFISFPVWRVEDGDLTPPVGILVSKKCYLLGDEPQYLWWNYEASRDGVGIITLKKEIVSSAK